MSITEIDDFIASHCSHFICPKSHVEGKCPYCGKVSECEHWFGYGHSKDPNAISCETYRAERQYWIGKLTPLTLSQGEEL